jgi:hypothetical protein
MSSLQEIAFLLRESRDSCFQISKSVTADAVVRDRLQKFSAIKIVEKYHAFMKPELPAYACSVLKDREIDVEN